MLSKEERQKKYTCKPEHLAQRLKERKYLFPYGSTLAENWTELNNAIRDPNKSIIIKDDRHNADSTHVCIFVGDSGQIIAVPIALNAKTIHIFTIKDVRTEQDNPNWYIRAYNEIAKTRGMNSLPLIIK